MAYRILTNEIIMLNHKAFVDHTLESHRFHNSEIQSAVMKPELFHIVVPYDGKPTRDEARDKRKSRKRQRVEDNLDEITQKVKDKHLEYLGLLGLTEGVTEGSNSIALEFIDKFNRSSYYDVDNMFSGANESQFIVNTVINNEDFIIPSNCRFFNTDVRNLSDHITIEDRFDLIVMDPPWWNKYIRRTKAVNEQSGYRMLDNESLKSIPIENHIHDRTIVAIWCTNSPTHTSAIEEQFCPKWNLIIVGSWFWTKVTEHGMPVCSFNETTKKQPYERLFVAVSSDSSIKNIPRERYIFSVPCAIHSNKPPLLDVFADLLPERPKCLELFARNVYPNFTSIGTEVLKLQNSRLFQLSLKHEVQ